MEKRVAYIMSRFPHLPETFILREMIALERLGWRVSLYPLIVQKQALVHAEAEAWVPRAQNVPWISGPIIGANMRRFFRQPRKYLETFGQMARENSSSLKFLGRSVLLFPKAVYMAERIEQEGIQHIHAHYATHPALAAWIIHRLTGITYSVTVHAHDIFVEKVMLGTKLKSASFISAISRYNICHLTKLLGDWVADNSYVVRCGIDPAYYQPHLSGRKPGERLEIVAVGSLQPYKGHSYLVDACAELHARGLDFRCRIAGAGDLGGALEAQIDRLGLRGRVELVGAMTQAGIAQLLAEADCFVQPSVVMSSGKMEGIPVALMEAMASQVAVVATEISGVPELVIQGETGWLVPPEDTKTLADVLSQICADPQEMERRALAGYRWVLEEFELSRNAKKLAALFEPFVVIN